MPLHVVVDSAMDRQAGNLQQLHSVFGPVLFREARLLRTILRF